MHLHRPISYEKLKSVDEKRFVIRHRLAVWQTICDRHNFQRYGNLKSNGYFLW
ncbi:hypothetical protein [Nostoc sp.]|uniref:hypothetical protein n=1 Tax=Nostoc sp. TaxID=1180 RepID=UPI002FFAC172